MLGSLEEPTHRTPTYDSIYRRGNGQRTEEIYKRQEISEEEKVEVSLYVSREFSLPIQLRIIEDKNSQDKHQRQDV